MTKEKKIIKKKNKRSNRSKNSTRAAQDSVTACSVASNPKNVEIN